MQDILLWKRQRQHHRHQSESRNQNRGKFYYSSFMGIQTSPSFKAKRASVNAIMLLLLGSLVPISIMDYVCSSPLINMSLTW